MKRKIKIAAFAQLKNGQVRVKNGRMVTVRTACHVLERLGPWAITPFIGMGSGINAGGYQLTHVGTGFCCFQYALSKAEAKRALRLFASLPNQARWARLKNKGHMTAQMIADGRGVIAQVRGS